MNTNYDNHPILQKCFFCKANDAQKKYAYRAVVNETLYKDAASHNYKQYKFSVPRCSDCAKIYVKFMLVLSWMIFSAFLMLIPLFFFSLYETVDFGGIVVLIVFIAIFVWSIVINTRMRRKYPNHINPQKTAAEYLSLIKRIEDERGESNK